MTKRIKLSTRSTAAVTFRIVMGTDEYRALEAICEFLRVRTASAAIRWALITAGAVVKQKKQELPGRVALQAELDKSNRNLEGTRFADMSFADKSRALAYNNNNSMEE